MRSALVMIGVAAFLMMLPTACEESCGDDLGCGPPVSVDFDRPIAFDAKTLVIELSYDNQILHCETRPEGATCGTELTRQDLFVSIGGSSGLRGFQLLNVTPSTLGVRVLRSDQVIAEEVLTPAYRNHQCPRCKQAPTLTMHIPATADGGV